MKRRNFIQFAAAGAATSPRPGLAAPVTPSRPVLFHAGTQQGHSPDVLRSLEELGDMTREIFILFRLENMKQKDIAALYGIGQSTVEKHVVKAVVHLSRRHRNE